MFLFHFLRMAVDRQWKLETDLSQFASALLSHSCCFSAGFFSKILGNFKRFSFRQHFVANQWKSLSPDRTFWEGDFIFSGACCNVQKYRQILVVIYHRIMRELAFLLPHCILPLPPLWHRVVVKPEEERSLRSPRSRFLRWIREHASGFTWIYMN